MTQNDAEELRLLKACFQETDVKGNGTIDKTELHDILKEVLLDFTEDDVSFLLQRTCASPGPQRYNDFLDAIFSDVGAQAGGRIKQLYREGKLIAHATWRPHSFIDRVSSGKCCCISTTFMHRDLEAVNAKDQQKKSAIFGRAHPVIILLDASKLAKYGCLAGDHDIWTMSRITSLEEYLNELACPTQKTSSRNPKGRVEMQKPVGERGVTFRLLPEATLNASGKGKSMHEVAKEFLQKRSAEFLAMDEQTKLAWINSFRHSWEATADAIRNAPLQEKIDNIPVTEIWWQKIGAEAVAGLMVVKDGVRNKYTDNPHSPLHIDRLIDYFRFRSGLTHQIDVVEYYPGQSGSDPEFRTITQVGPAPSRITEVAPVRGYLHKLGMDEPALEAYFEANHFDLLKSLAEPHKEERRPVDEPQQLLAKINEDPSASSQAKQLAQQFQLFFEEVPPF